jgi:hypothetical protein
MTFCPIHPIIVELYVIAISLQNLENEISNTDDISKHLEDEFMASTDVFEKVEEQALSIYKTRDSIQSLITVLSSRVGEG